MKITNVILFGLLVFGASASSGQVIKCPTIQVDPGTESPRGPVVFLVQLTGLNPTARPEFRWEVSTGTIISGQGTSSIVVDTAELGGQTLTAKVKVTGIETTCPAEASRSINVPIQEVICNPPFDSYGDIDFEAEKARLDNFAIQIFNTDNTTGYLLAYAGRRSYENEAAERLQRAKDYLVKVRKVPLTRIVTVDGGYRENFEVTLLLRFPDTTPPVPQSYLSPGEVELTKPRPQSLKKKRSKRN